MSKKKGKFIDQYLDKIILGLTGLLALYLAWAFILSNPWGAKVGGRKLSPAEIDEYNARQARQIQDKLGDPAPPGTGIYPGNKADEMSKLLEDPMPKISLAAVWPLPGGGQAGTGDREYIIPRIPVMDNVKFATLRGTVQMPTEEVTPEITYMAAASEAKDIDFVTFSARLDMQSLYDNFKQSFMGMRLKPQWRDAMLAEPVFARIELQRRNQREDGSWADWETVSYNRIDPYQKIFRDIPMTTEEMSYGNVELFMNSCRAFAVMKDILQPPSYVFLSGQTKWLPAQFYLEVQQKLEEQEKEKAREERDRRLSERERTPGANRPGGGGGLDMPRRQTDRQTGRGRGGRGDTMMDETMLGPGGMPGQPRPGRPPTKTVQDIERQADTAKIDEKTKINTLKELIVWVHDDSVEPGTTYQYRIRYGVFNPIAGRDWFAQESMQYKNQVVLWSPYTEFADSIKIPKMLHLFPSDVLTDGTGVAVDIFRYYMGRWHTENFKVSFGQMIGKQIESKPKTTADGMNPAMEGLPPMPMQMEGMMNPGFGDMSGQPMVVDFSTEYMLLDVQANTQWIVPGVRPQEVKSMLYLDKNSRILILPVKQSFWPREMKTEYAAVKSEYSKTLGVTIDGMMGGEGGFPGMQPRMQDYGGV